jgi:hypothetical protein
MFPLLKPDKTSNDDLLKLELFGFKVTPGGAHSSRTMMLDEVRKLLTAAPISSDDSAYRTAILDDNLLGKKTEDGRKKTFRFLRELFGLSRSIPFFLLYRQLYGFDKESLPLLSMLVALARDPQFRATAEIVLDAKEGQEISSDDFQSPLLTTFGKRYSPNNIGKISRNAASSWTQSGHLSGRTRKIRLRVNPRPAAVTLALILSYLGGWRDEQIFSTWWCRVLDLNPVQARSLAVSAHREGLISMKGIDTVFELDFPRFNMLLEKSL